MRLDPVWKQHNGSRLSVHLYPRRFLTHSTIAAPGRMWLQNKQTPDGANSIQHRQDIAARHGIVCRAIGICPVTYFA